MFERHQLGGRKDWCLHVGPDVGLGRHESRTRSATSLAGVRLCDAAGLDGDIDVGNAERCCAAVLIRVCNGGG